MKALNTEMFIEKAKDVHGDNYDYSECVYTNQTTQVKIICIKHGAFYQRPKNHMAGRGCQLCAIDLSSSKRKLSTEDFIERAKEVHGDLYIYSDVYYKTSYSKIKIICPTHGAFYQAPFSHLKGSGCMKCSYIKRGNSKSLSTSEFIKKATEKHGDLYDYSEAIYVNTDTQVRIICNKHYVFFQTPDAHINGGSGCPKCAVLQRSKKRTYSTNDFIERAKIVHGDKYEYSNVIYNGGQHKVDIICPKHGVFKQQASSHLAGTGCNKCAGRVSKEETELLNLIKLHGLNALSNKKISKTRENTFRFDIVIKENKVLIEYNGIWWHCIENKHEEYHKEKREHAEKNGYRLITIWEDDWIKDKKAVNTKIIKILSGKEDIYRGKEVVLDLDYQCYKKYLRNGYRITSIAPVAIRRRRNSGDPGYPCYNSGVAVLRKA